MPDLPHACSAVLKAVLLPVPLPKPQPLFTAAGETGRQAFAYLARVEPKVRSEPLDEWSVARVHPIVKQLGELEHHLQELLLAQAEIFHLAGMMQRG